MTLFWAIPKFVPNLTGLWKSRVLIGLGWILLKLVRILRKPKNQNGKRFRRTIRKVSSKRGKNWKNQKSNFSDFIRNHSNIERTLGTHNGYIPAYQNCRLVFTNGSGLRRDEEQVEKGRSGRYSKGGN